MWSAPTLLPRLEHRWMMLAVLLPLVLGSLASLPISAQTVSQTLVDTPGQYALRPTSYANGVSALNGTYEGVGFDELLASASSPVDLDTESLCANAWENEPVSQVIEFQDHFCWQTTDRSDGWKPQGIAGSPSGNSLLVSWYTESTPDSLVATESAGDGGGVAGSAARLSMVDMNRRVYRHVELVKPCDESPTQVCKLDSHAGGLAWIGPWVYLANTDGLYVFNTEQIFRVEGSPVIPATARWDLTSSDVRISSVSVDRTGASPELVSVEYVDDGRPTTVLRWALAGDGSLGDGSTEVSSVLRYDTEIGYLQGVAAWNGTYLLSSSHASLGPDAGGAEDAMLRRLPNQTSEPCNANFVMPSQNTQSLYIDGERELVWSLTEDDTSSGNYAYFVYAYTLSSALAGTETC